MEIITVTLSPKTLAAKNCFMEKYKPKIPRRLIGSALGQHSEHVYVIEAYLKEVYKIKVPESFSKTILSAHFKNFPSCNFNMSFKIVDAIYQSCYMWRNYLTSAEDFVNLLCGELISFAAIKCSVISASDLQKKTNVHLKRLPAQKFETIVDEKGIIKIMP